MSTAAARQAPYPVRAVHKRCGKCGKLVARDAFQCRRCGKQQRLRPRTILLVLSGCLLVGMFAAAALGGSPPSASTGGTSGALASAGGVPATDNRNRAGEVRVTAAELWLEYTRDRASADQRFRDRPVVVSGTVRAIERDFDGGFVVRFTTGDSLDTVNAKLASRDDASLRDLSKGHSASLGCVGRGALIGAPLLGNCSVL